MGRTAEGKARHLRAMHALQKQQRLDLVLRAKSEPCSDCKLSYPHWVMQLDHLPGTVKLFPVGGNKTSKSLNALRAEIAKCEAVCANCHANRTFCRQKQIPLAAPPLGKVAEVPSNVVPIKKVL